MSEIFHIFASIMTDEQIAAKKEHAGEKKASMKRRDDHHDYTERRMYMKGAVQCSAGSSATPLRPKEVRMSLG